MCSDAYEDEYMCVFAHARAELTQRTTTKASMRDIIHEMLLRGVIIEANNTHEALNKTSVTCCLVKGREIWL